MQKWALHLCSPRVPAPSWVKMSGPLILFGLYCGFTATLPMGLYLLSIARIAPASEREIGGGSVASVSVMGQLVIILSVYYLRTYVTLVKPHAVTLLVLPYILFCRHRILYHLSLGGEEGALRATTGLHTGAAASRAYAATSRSSITVRSRRNTLLDIFLVSLFHYVFLFSPAPARLVKLIVYRRSDQFIFAVSSLCGWFGGSILLKYLVELLAVTKIDSYDGFYGLGLVDGRLINRISSILVTALCLLYLGRTPVPVSFSEKRHEFRSDGSIQELSWLDTWPTSVFDYRRGVRPFRYVKDCYNSASPSKREISEHCFHSSVVNGGQRLSLSFIPSLSIFGNNLDRYINTVPGNPTSTGGDPIIYREWVRIGERKGSYLNNELTDRLGALEHGYSLIEVVDTENGFYGQGKSAFARIYDPCLSKKLRGRILELRSTWLLTHRAYRRIAPNYFSWGYTYLTRASAKGGRNTRTRREELAPTQGYVSKSNYYLSVVARLMRMHDDAWLGSIFKQKPQNVSNLMTNDTSLGPSNDIRSMRVKNVTYVINERTGVPRVRKRPVLQPDYRRNLVIGSMRARRRKTLVWEPSQYRTKSTFSLRFFETDEPPQSIPDMNAKSISVPCLPREEARLKNFITPHATIVTGATRAATAKRWDFPTAHWVRGCLLISQSYIRRNVVLPTLIMLKNICYFVVFQTSDWAEDWNELGKEIYVGCNYDGTEVSSKGLPPLWHREGVQIKIVNPFHLKHRHNLVPKRLVPGHYDETEFDPTVTTRNGGGKPASSCEAGRRGRSSFGGEPGYGYLTMLGFQTTLPFGSRKRRAPSFWKPFLKDAKLKWSGNILGIRQIIHDRVFSRSGRGPDTHAEHREPSVDTSTDGSRGDIALGFEPGEHARCSYELNGGSNDFPNEVTIGKECLQVGAPSALSEYMARASIEELESFLRRSRGRANDKTIGLPYRERVPAGSLSGEDQRHLDGTFLRDMPIPTNRTSRGMRTQLIRIMTRLVRALLRGARRFVFGCRSLSTRFNLRLVKRLMRQVLRVRSYAGMYFGRSEDQSGSDTNPFIRARDSVAGKGWIDPPGHSRGARLISRAYAFCAVWRLGAGNKCPRSIGLECHNHKLCADVKRGTYSPAASGTQGILGGEPRAIGRRAWDKWLLDLRQYDVPPEIWRRIAPQRWSAEVGHLCGDNFGNNSQEKDQAMGLGEAVPQRVTPAGFAQADTIRAGKIDRQCKGNLLSQSYLELASTLAGVRVCPSAGAPRQGGVLAPNARTPWDMRQNCIVNYENGGRTKEGRMNVRNGINSNLRLWLYIGIIKRFHILEMPDCIATRSLKSITREPNISFIGGRAFAGRQSSSYDWIGKEFWEYRIDRWDLRSEQLAARMTKVRDATNALHALPTAPDSAGSAQRSRLESIYESMLRDMALLLYYARADRKGTLQENQGHRIAEAVDDRFLTCKMLSVLLNFQNRFKVILYLVPYDELMSRIRVLGNRNGTISYSSHIGDTLLPRRRTELGILESLHRGELDSGDRRAEFKGSAAGSHEQRNGEPLTQDWRNAAEAETRIMKSIIWPCYRLEDLSCMNRFWFNTSNGSRFAMPRVCLYP
uniref:Hypothetical chloroplast RF1 n=1 Tax=Selaginella lepidophylla TaxID=59777 RepID=A0A3T0IB03_SELLP|nr:hypothetical chloroplast RF1 [Selaginella lepidophylla]AZU95879.1 hypothetical chloroplast RF1 [Selaginella lepidophylla]